jgi:hypothetical protein
MRITLSRKAGGGVAPLSFSNDNSPREGRACPCHPAVGPTALILRSSREAASRRRVRRALNSPFETPLVAGPQEEAREAIGIMALSDTLCRHGRARPGHPDAVRRCASIYRDHWDEPGDDEGGDAEEGEDGVRCNVLTLFLTRCIIRAIPLCIPARRGARSRGVADVGRGAVLRQASQACWREALGSRVLVQVETPKSTACEAPSGSSILPLAIEPACPAHLPRSTPRLRAPGLRVLALWNPAGDEPMATLPRLAPAGHPC